METSAGNASSSRGLTDADQALLQSLSAWRKRSPAADDLVSRLWRWLDPSWAGRLRDVWDHGSTVLGSDDPAAALNRLRRAHAATARVDFGRVHPSWWVRALQEESPAVQRVVAASAPAFVSQPVRDGLLLDSQGIAVERSINPEVLSWTLALWTERLVGGEPERHDDPPALLVFSRLSPRAGYRLCQMTGIAKGVLAGEDPGNHRPGPVDQARWEWLQTRLASVDLQFRVQARSDVQSISAPKVPRRHYAARIGLGTLARLLADCEPFRVRWALQHWPYPIAKLVRFLMAAASNRSASQVRSESLVLKTAWDRLTLEGRLAISWSNPNRETTSGSHLI
jgi:hypothetical protein